MVFSLQEKDRLGVPAPGVFLKLKNAK